MYKKVILKAYEEKYAIPQFNFDSVEVAKFILEECQRLNSPVFLAVSQGAIKYIGGFNTVVGIVRGLLKDLNITIPVILHLDHGKNLDICKDAINHQFISIMLDNSYKPLEENIDAIKKISKYKKNIIVECEIGSIGEKGDQLIKYASVEDCIKMKKLAKPFMLAPAIGTVHGLYKGKQNIDIELLKQINQNLQMPLVLHGGSDTDDEIIKQCIQNGICKININTNLKQAWTRGVVQYINSNRNEYDYRKFIKNSEKYIKKVVEEKINLFGSKGKA